MKTYLSAIVFICSISISLPIQAQLQKGQTFLSGGLSFRNEDYNINNNEYQGNGLNFNLGIGQLLSDKLALSFGLSFSGNKSVGFQEVFTPQQLGPDGKYLYTQEVATTKDAYSTLRISVGVNNYITLRERLAMVLSSSFLVAFRSNEFSQRVEGRDQFTTNSKQTDYALSFSPGLLYFLSPRFALSGNFGGLSLTVTPRTKENPATSISGDFTTEGILGIGLNYFFK